MQWRYYKHFFNSRDQANKKLQLKFKVQIFMYNFGSTHCVELKYYILIYCIILSYSEQTE